MCGSPSTVTTTNSPPPQVLQNYADVTSQAKNVSSAPYQPYTGELTAPLNQGQNNAIGQLQAGYGTANPYINSGSGYLDNASSGLGNVQNYLQTASGLGNISGFQSDASGNLGTAGSLLQSAYNTSGQMAGAYNQSASMATPQAFNNGAALQQYMSPYTQSVINSTMANAQQQDAIQAQQLSSNAIGQGAYGGDRAGIAQAALAGQQALANNQTIAGLENQNYTQALGQYNTGVGQQQAGAQLMQGVGAGYGQQATLAGNIGQAYSGIAGQFGNLGNQQLGQAGLYNTLGTTQGQQAQSYGQLAGQAGNLGQIAQNTNTAGASAALQASTLQQQTQQQQDAAAYQQFQNAIQYPFQTTGYLANIDMGVGNGSGGSTTSPGPSTLSQVVGAGTTGLGILGAIGGSGGASAGYNTVASGLGSLFSDVRVKEDIAPIGKTFDGQTMYRYRYKGDPTVRTGLMAQEVEHHAPGAVSEVGGLKAVEYGAATDRAAARGHFARGGGLGAIRPRFDAGGVADPNAAASGLNFSPAGLTNGSGFNPTAGSLGGVAAPVAQNRPGVAPPRLPVVGGAPIAQQPMNILPAGASASPFGGSGASGLGGINTNPNAEQNKWLGVAAAGLGMMGGTSPFAMTNIGQGGLEGLKMYMGLQQQDRQNALAQADIGFRQRSADNAAQQLQLEIQRLKQQNEIQTGQLANQTSSTQSENMQRRAATAGALQTQTPYGIMQRDPENPLAPPKLIPWSQILGPNGGGQPSAATPAGQPSTAPVGANAPAGADGAPSKAPVVPNPGDVSSIGAFDPPSNIPINPMLITNPKFVEDQTTKTLDQHRTAYEGAQTQKMLLAEMQHDLSQLPTTGWLAAGPGQQQRVELASKMNTLLSGLGVKDVLVDPNAIASSEDMKKLTGRMGFELARSLGGREPGFIVQQSVGLNPGTENTPIGAQRLIAGLNAAAQRNIDLYNFEQKWVRTSNGDLTGAEDYFNTHAPPQAYARAAIVSTIDPRDVAALKDNAKNPAAAAAINNKYGNGVSSLILGQQ